MNVLDRTPDGGAVVRVSGNGLGDTARPGHRLVLKEVSGPLAHGALYLFRSPGGVRLYRRVERRGPNAVALVPESEDGRSPIVLRRPEDEGKFEVLARVDRVLKPL